MKRKNLPDGQRCEAYVYDMYGEKLKGRCSNGRHFRVGNKELCGRHAALESMHVAFKAGKIKLLVNKIPRMYGAVRTTMKEPKP